MNKQYVLFFTLLSIGTSRFLLSQDSEASFFEDAAVSTEESSKKEFESLDNKEIMNKKVEEVSQDQEVKKDIEQKIDIEKSAEDDQAIEVKKPARRHERIGFGGKGLQEAARASRRSKTRSSLDDIKPEERKRKYARRSGYSSKKDKELSSRMKKVGERSARMERRARDAGVRAEKAAGRKPIVHTGRIKNPREGRVGRKSVSTDESFEPTHLDRSARRATPAFLRKREEAREKQEEKKSISKEEVASKESETFEE